MDRFLAEVLAYKLAELRREQDLTQRDIADSMGVSTPRISAIEHGEIDRTEVATLRAYVRALAGSSGSWRTSGTRRRPWPERGVGQLFQGRGLVA